MSDHQKDKESDTSAAERQPISRRRFLSNTLFVGFTGGVGGKVGEWSGEKAHDVKLRIDGDKLKADIRTVRAVLLLADTAMKIHHEKLMAIRREKFMAPALIQEDISKIIALSESDIAGLPPAEAELVTYIRSSNDIIQNCSQMIDVLEQKSAQLKANEATTGALVGTAAGAAMGAALGVHVNRVVEKEKKGHPISNATRRTFLRDMLDLAGVTGTGAYLGYLFKSRSLEDATHALADVILGVLAKHDAAKERYMQAMKDRDPRQEAYREELERIDETILNMEDRYKQTYGVKLAQDARKLRNGILLGAGVGVAGVAYCIGFDTEENTSRSKTSAAHKN
jgi:hypothetical protein